jgi:hypothetical protein
MPSSARTGAAPRATEVKPSSKVSAMRLGSGRPAEHLAHLVQGDVTHVEHHQPVAARLDEPRAGGLDDLAAHGGAAKELELAADGRLR